MLGKVCTALMAAMLAAAHPTAYPQVARSKMPTNPPPPILSWHVHVVFNLNEKVLDRALALRNKTTEHFADFLGPNPNCKARFDEGRLCMIEDHDFRKVLTVGPFPAGEWSLFVPLPHKQMVVEWMIQNRGEFDVLVHPNSGWEFHDHTVWASWTGNSWPLNTSPDVLGPPDARSNEFNHTRGDIDNMVCIPSSFPNTSANRCHSGSMYAVCCPDSACIDGHCQ